MHTNLYCYTFHRYNLPFYMYYKFVLYFINHYTLYRYVYILIKESTIAAYSLCKLVVTKVRTFLPSVTLSRAD